VRWVRQRRVGDLEGPQPDLERRLVEVTGASTQDSWHEMQAEFLNVSSLQVLAGDVRVTVDQDVLRAGSLAGLASLMPWVT
jgi:hypothetical protein